MPYNVRGKAEFEFVTRQSRRGALCPFCNVWHSSTDGKAMEGDCKGLYIRYRQAAFVVRALKKGRAGVVDGEPSDDYPTGRNLERARAEAIKKKYQG